MLAELNHPNIAQIYGLEEIRQHPLHRHGAGGRRDARGAVVAICKIYGRRMVELWRKDIFQHARLVCVASWATDAEQIDAQEALFPSSEAIPFGSGEALLASDVYAKIKRPRGREIDIAIAACAIAHDAQLWTVNPADF